MNIWHDEYLWEKGHWVNHKFSSVTLAKILCELSLKSMIEIDRIDVTQLDESIDGLCFNKPNMSAMDIINLLRVCYFFDLIANDFDRISFIKRGYGISYDITSQDFIKLQSNVSYFQREDISESNIINAINISYINYHDDYKIDTCYTHSERKYSCVKTSNISLPIVGSYQEINRLGNMILQNAAIESKIVRFILPDYVFAYRPTDFVRFTHLGFEYNIRLIDIELSSRHVRITGIVDNVLSYNMLNYRPLQSLKCNVIDQDELKILKLPFLIDNDNAAIMMPYMALYLSGAQSKKLYLKTKENEDYYYIAQISSNSAIGIVLYFNQEDNIEMEVGEDNTTIQVQCRNFKDSVNKNSSSLNLAMWGDEIIRFDSFESLGDDIYQVTRIYRGLYETNRRNHFYGEQFIILASYSYLLPIAHLTKDTILHFKLDSDIETQIPIV
ncbi:MAG: phage tail protein [Rickettsiaceae bacterium]